MIRLALCAALILVGCSAGACSPPNQITESEGMKPVLARGKSETGQLRISLPDDAPSILIAEIGLAEEAGDRSATVAIEDARSGRRIAAPTIYPAGSTVSVVLELPDGTEELIFTAIDPVTGKPLGQGQPGVVVQLRPQDR